MALETWEALQALNGVVSSIAAAVESQLVLPINKSRSRAIFVNTTTNTYYLMFSSNQGADLTTSFYSVSIAAGASYELNFAYTGAVYGISGTAGGTILVTELSGN